MCWRSRGCLLAHSFTPTTRSTLLPVVVTGIRAHTLPAISGLEPGALTIKLSHNICTWRFVYTSQDPQTLQGIPAFSIVRSVLHLNKPARTLNGEIFNSRRLTWLLMYFEISVSSTERPLQIKIIKYALGLINADCTGWCFCGGGRINFDFFF